MLKHFLNHSVSNLCYESSLNFCLPDHPARNHKALVIQETATIQESETDLIFLLGSITKVPSTYIPAENIVPELYSTLAKINVQHFFIFKASYLFQPTVLKNILI